MSKFQDWNEDAFVAIISGKMKAEIQKVIGNMIALPQELKM